MRCRKARSLLSAASSDELSGRRLLAVREHLSSCADCRREAAIYESICHAVKETPRPTVKDDFNSRLLNRIAQERFAETRTKAHLPHRTPTLVRRILVPATTAVTLGLVAAIGLIMTSPSSQGPQLATAPAPMDDSYLTAQPTNNPNVMGRSVATGMAPDWSLAQQVSRAERFDRLTRRLTDRNGFANLCNGGNLVSSVSPDDTSRMSGQPVILQLPQGVRVYRAGTTSGAEEVNKAY